MSGKPFSLMQTGRGALTAEFPGGYRVELPAGVTAAEIEADYDAYLARARSWTPPAAERREEAYNTARRVDWGGETLTVTEAAQLWQYYAAEGSDRADALRALIRAAKAEIRETYPDGEEE